MSIPNGSKKTKGEKMMKKITLLMALAMVLAVSSCGKKNTDDVISETPDIEIEQEVEATPEAMSDPTAAPTDEATKSPTKAPTKEPTKAPTQAPTKGPTKAPTQAPTPTPTQKPTPAPTPVQDTRSLDELMTKITSNLGEMPMTGTNPLDAENFEFFTFAGYVDGAEGIVCEPMMSSIAHSVVLVRLPQGTDAAAFANKMKANADPRKWICVEAEKVSVASKGNLALLVMSASDTTDKIIANFKNL